MRALVQLFFKVLKEGLILILLLLAVKVLFPAKPPQGPPCTGPQWPTFDDKNSRSF